MRLSQRLQRLEKRSDLCPACGRPRSSELRVVWRRAGEGPLPRGCRVCDRVIRIRSISRGAIRVAKEQV